MYNPQSILFDENHFEKNDGDQRVAGGSSGGSAAAVASGMCFAWVDVIVLVSYFLSTEKKKFFL